jgi:transposase InsO family protein
MDTKDRYTVTEMTGLFGVSRSAYYQWEKQGVSDRRERADAELVEKLRALQEEHHGRYGAPRMRAELRKQGIGVRGKRIGKLLRKHGLNAKRRRPFIPTTQSNHGLPICGNLLNRDFDAVEPGRKWVSDLTYLHTREGWRYLTVVLDLCGRKVMGVQRRYDNGTHHRSRAHDGPHEGPAPRGAALSF